MKLVSFPKKTFINKEKSGTAKKVKLLTIIQKFKKQNIKQFYFGTLELACHCYCEGNE